MFIIDAGFSRHLSQKINPDNPFPVTKELIDLIKNEHKKTSNAPTISQPCWDEFHKNTQDNKGDLLKVLTQINLLGRDEASLESFQKELTDILRKRLSLQSLFNWGPDEIKLPADHEVYVLLKQLFRAGDTLINMNWDTLLEHLLAKKHIDKWCPHCGYGPVKSPRSLWECSHDFRSIISLKPHGAFIFNKTLLIPTGNPSADLSVGIGKPTEALTEDLSNSDFNKWPFENTGYFSWENPVVTPPIAIPNYIRGDQIKDTYRKIHVEASKKIEQAQQIIIIGYSFPDDDVLIDHLMSYALDKNNPKSIYILNDTKTCEKLKNQFIRLTLDKLITTYQFDPDSIDPAYKNLINALNDSPESRHEANRKINKGIKNRGWMGSVAE